MINISFLQKYKILPPLFGLITGTLLVERLGNEWAMVVLLSPIFGLISVWKPRLSFLIFIPLGILFAARPNLPENHILQFTGKEVDVEGVLFKSPESRTRGSRLFVDVQSVFVEGKEEHVSGKAMITTEERIGGLAHGDRIRALQTTLRPFRNFKNPGGFDIERYYERQGVYAAGFTVGEGWIISFGKDESSNPFIHTLDKLRARFGTFVREKAPSPEGEILNAVTIGDQGGIPPELRNQFSGTGVAHILSVSGLHVGAVAVVFYFLIKWVLKRSEFLLLRFQVPRLAAALTVVPVFIYTVVAGFATPAVRAFIMVTVYLISVAVGRGESKLNTLAVAAFIILVWHPWALFELSFQLSFASVSGILLMNRFYPLKLNTLEDKLLSSVKTTLAATFATLPLVVNSFGVFPVVSVPANLFSVPIAEFLIVPLGLVSFLVLFASEGVSNFLIYVNVFLLKLFILITKALLEVPFSSLTVPSLGGLSWTFYGLTLSALLFRRASPKVGFVLPLLAVSFLAVSAYAVMSRPDKGFLRLDFLDAGSKSIVFMKLPQGKTVLVSGGFSRHDRGDYIEAGVVVPFLLKSGVTKIDYLILTSLDKSHLAGVKTVLERFHVERLWTNGGKLDGELWETIKNGNTNWKNVLDDVETLETEGVRIEFFQPRGRFALEDSSQPYPLIGKLRFGELDFLFGEGLTRDEVQRELVETYGNRIQSDVLYLPKVSGWINSDFIKIVSPQVVVINSVFGKLPNLPHVAVSDNGGKSKPRLFQTDAQGMVTVLTDGKRTEVRTFAGEKKEIVY